jgi:hypothetical protein
MLTSVTLGATPAVPSPFSPAATSPATCVPWPLSSTSLGSTQDGTSQGPSIRGMSVAKLRLSRRLKLARRSGWPPSMPESMIPTSTPRRPWLTR